jgi:integration host factor subunit beta
MTRSDIIKRMFKARRELLVGDLERIIDMINETIVKALATGARVELRGFGVFSPKHLAKKNASSPQGGKRIVLPERTSVKFKAGKILAKKINRAEDGDAK